MNFTLYNTAGYQRVKSLQGGQRCSIQSGPPGGGHCNDPCSPEYQVVSPTRVVTMQLKSKHFVVPLTTVLKDMEYLVFLFSSACRLGAVPFGGGVTQGEQSV